MQSGYLNVDGSKLYYELAGEGEALALVHAGFVDSGMWDAQWEAFAHHYRVVRFDMRGFGKSDAVQAPVSRRDELYRLLKHLEIDRAHLVGCSLGGEVVMDFALEHPEMVASLVVVLSVPGGFEMQGEPPADMLEMFGALETGDLKRVSELQVRLWVDGGFRTPEQVDPAVRRRAAEMNWIAVSNGTFAADLAPANPLDPPAATRLDAIHVPTLEIVGALDHPEILRAADVMVGALKDAQKVIVADAAHVPNMERPDAFNAAVLRFLGGK